MTLIIMLLAICVAYMLAIVSRQKRVINILEDNDHQQALIIDEYREDYLKKLSDWQKSESLLVKNEDQLNEANVEIRRLRDELGEL